MNKDWTPYITEAAVAAVGGLQKAAEITWHLTMAHIGHGESVVVPVHHYGAGAKYHLLVLHILLPERLVFFQTGAEYAICQERFGLPLLPQEDPPLARV